MVDASSEFQQPVEFSLSKHIFIACLSETNEIKDHRSGPRSIKKGRRALHTKRPMSIVQLSICASTALSVVCTVIINRFFLLDRNKMKYSTGVPPSAWIHEFFSTHPVSSVIMSGSDNCCPLSAHAQWHSAHSWSGGWPRSFSFFSWDDTKQKLHLR